MFDLKKFIAFIGTENKFMQIFYDKAEAEGLDPRFDIFHVIAGNETPSDGEIKIMKAIYESDIKGTDFEKIYDTAVRDFEKRIKERNKMLANRLSQRPFKMN